MKDCIVKIFGKDVDFSLEMHEFENEFKDFYKNLNKHEQSCFPYEQIKQCILTLLISAYIKNNTSIGEIDKNQSENVNKKQTDNKKALDSLSTEEFIENIKRLQRMQKILYSNMPEKYECQFKITNRLSSDKDDEMF